MIISMVLKNFTLFGLYAQKSAVLLPVKNIAVYSIWLVITFYLFGCQNSSDNRNDPEFEERIILGQSIDSVEVGDSTSSVVMNLGEPSEISYGDFAGFIYMYKEGEFAGLDIMFADDLDNRVVRVLAKSPYNGTTSEGIGISTTREIVQRSLGLPDTNAVQADWRTFGESYMGDTYLYDSLAFVYTYTPGDKVNSIVMILISF